MAITFNDNILNRSPKSLDAKVGVFESGTWRPYNSISEAINSIPVPERYIGLMVDITDENGTTKYWFKEGIANNNLVLFNPAIFEVTASNGLHIDIPSGDVQLGGILTQTAIIDTNGNTLTIGGTGIVTIDGITSQFSAGGNTYGIELNGNLADKMVVFDGRSLELRKGLENAGDFSANWTDHSLITKKWALDTFGVGSNLTFDNGLTRTGDNIVLGGDFSEDILIGATNKAYSLHQQFNVELGWGNGSNELYYNSISQFGISWVAQFDNELAAIDITRALGNKIRVTDEINGKGIYLADNYAPNWINGIDDLVLVNKGYVDEENRKSILQNIKSYSILEGLDANKRNYGFVLTADSNGEGYVSTGVGENNWFTILTRNIQSIQGGKSGIGFSDFNDPSRYGITISSGVSILPYGPVKQGLFMNAGSSITFSAAADFVEVWYWNDTVAGSLEFRRNGVLYRTVSAAGAHNEAVSSFDETPTPDGSMATYEIKAVDSSVFVTTLFKDIKYAEGNDTYYFLRHAVAGKSFDDFDLPQLLAVNSLSTEVPRAIYLCALGTNSIYSPDKAQTSTAYAASLRSYIQTLKVNDNKFVYIMPPKGLETTYPPILEPYLNYYDIAKQVCLEERVMFIDVNELDFNTHPEYYGSDGLHYSDAGHAALASFVTNQLAKADLRSFDYLTPADVATGKEIGANTTGSAQYWNSQVYDGSVNNAGLGLLMGYNLSANKWTYFSLNSIKTGLNETFQEVFDRASSLTQLAGTGNRPISAAADGTLGIDTGGARLAGGNVFTGGHQDVRSDGDFRVYNTASGASNYNSALNSGGVVLTSTDQGTVTTYGQNFLNRLHSSGFYSRLIFATPASVNREYTLPDQTGTIALTSDIAITNTTTVVLSSATLTSMYPNAVVGFQVICPNIIVGGLIYTKYASGWVQTAITIVT